MISELKTQLKHYTGQYHIMDIRTFDFTRLWQLCLFLKNQVKFKLNSTPQGCPRNGFANWVRKKSNARALRARTLLLFSIGSITILVRTLLIIPITCMRLFSGLACVLNAQLCENEGTCDEVDGTSIECNCPVDYTGDFCEEGKFIFKKTC